MASGDRLLLQDQSAWQTQLMKHLSHWSWVHKLYQYSDKHLIIADEFFVDILRNARAKPLKAKTATPETYGSVLNAKIKKILVFCRSGELALVRKLQKKHPKIAVTSGTYGYMLTGPDRQPRMREFKPAIKGDGATTRPKPVLILSTAYAEAEFMAALMKANGLPVFHEYLGRPFDTWLQAHDYFQPLRFYRAAEQAFASGDTFHFLLQSDVLNRVFARSSFKERHFIKALEQADASVILVKRRDRVAQAISGQLLNRTNERSLWTKKATRSMACKYLPTDLNGCVQRQRLIAADEAMLDRVHASQASSREIYLEDFIADQASGLVEIAAFLGEAPPKDVQTLDYDAGFETAEHIPEAFTAYRRELTDRIGNHSRLLI